MLANNHVQYNGYLAIHQLDQSQNHFPSLESELKNIHVCMYIEYTHTHTTTYINTLTTF